MKNGGQHRCIYATAGYSTEISWGYWIFDQKCDKGPYNIHTRLSTHQHISYGVMCCGTTRSWTSITAILQQNAPSAKPKVDCSPASRRSGSCRRSTSRARSCRNIWQWRARQDCHHCDNLETHMRTHTNSGTAISRQRYVSQVSGEERCGVGTAG